MRYSQNMKLIIPQKEIQRAHLSLPGWEELAEKSLGFSRDKTRDPESYWRRAYPSRFRVGYDDHIESVRSDSAAAVKSGSACPGDFDTWLDSAAGTLVLSNGNLANNLRFIAYSRRKQPSVFQLRGESIATSPRDHFCLTARTDGTLAMETLSFSSNNSFGAEILWAASAPPILWDGEVVPHDQVLADSYDLRHIYDFDITRDGTFASPEAENKFLALMDLFIQHLGDERSVAAEALSMKAGDLGLKRNDSYLHNALGVDRKCSKLFVLQEIGPTEKLAQSLKEMGAWRALLIDQGGSVGTMLNHRLLCPSYYFRPERLSVFVFQLDNDDLQADSSL
jgi:hypothetical protein